MASSTAQFVLGKGTWNAKYVKCEQFLLRPPYLEEMLKDDNHDEKNVCRSTNQASCHAMRGSVRRNYPPPPPTTHPTERWFCLLSTNAWRAPFSHGGDVKQHHQPSDGSQHQPGLVPHEVYDWSNNGIDSSIHWGLFQLVQWYSYSWVPRCIAWKVRWKLGTFSVSGCQAVMVRDKRLLFRTEHRHVVVVVMPSRSIHVGTDAPKEAGTVFQG